jgi:hypothetical protein
MHSCGNKIAFWRQQLRGFFLLSLEGVQILAERDLVLRRWRDLTTFGSEVFFSYFFFGSQILLSVACVVEKVARCHDGWQ